MYYKGTEQECLDYVTCVNESEGYSGTTSTWANIIKHQSTNDYLVLAKTGCVSGSIDEDGNVTETMEVLQSIPDGWLAESEE